MCCCCFPRLKNPEIALKVRRRAIGGRRVPPLRLMIRGVMNSSRIMSSLQLIKSSLSIHDGLCFHMYTMPSTENEAASIELGWGTGWFTMVTDGDVLETFEDGFLWRCDCRICTLLLMMKFLRRKIGMGTMGQDWARKGQQFLKLE